MATKQNTGVVDGSGNPVLDGSGNPVMSGRFSDEDEITARGRARNAAMFKSFANRLTGKKEEAKKAAPAVSRPTRPGQETSGSKPAASRPTRPGQQVSGVKPAAKAKPAIVTKEELAKSGLSLRDYMNKQRGLTRRDGKAPEKAKPSTPAAKASKDNRPKASGAMIQSMDTDMMRAGSRAAAKQSGANRKAAISSKSAVTAEKPKALAISPGVLKQREADEKKRAERREFGRQRDEKKKAESADRDNMSSGQRSAARGAKIKEFFGMKKGGAVCMASKRADGIAVKGKTRGKVY